MNLPYQKILDELKKGPKTLEDLKKIDDGDVAESVLCLVARGLVKALAFDCYVRDEEALARERDL